MSFRIAIYFLFFSPLVAEAAGAGSIPIRFVFFQVLNFSLFVVALVYLLRKKLPPFLKQKRQDFLEYQKKAKDLEHGHQKDCLLLEKEIKSLIRKQENTQKMVRDALKDLRIEWEKQEEEWLENLKRHVGQELERQKIKQLGDLKTRLLSKVMTQVKTQLQEKEDAEFYNYLNYQGIQKWEET